MYTGIESNGSPGFDDSKVSRMNSLLEEVPSFSNVVLKAQKLFNTPDYSTEELADVLGSDPGLVAKILRIANSSFYGMSRQISSLHDACIILGQKALRSLVMTAAVMDIAKSSRVDMERYKHHMTHFIHSALIARDLARKIGLNGETAYLVGLLHDIGIIFIENIFTDELVHIREKAESNGGDCVKAEKSILGFDHAEFSGKIASLWQLPDEIRLPVENHHKEDMIGLNLTGVIYLADKLSSQLKVAEQGSDPINLFDQKLLSKIGLTQDEIVEYMKDMMSLVEAGVSELME